MTFVSNTSPLIFLAKLDALFLLDDAKIILPREVHDELMAKEGSEKDRLIHFLKKPHVSIEPFKKARFKRKIKSTILGKGELAVINLAFEKKISTIFLDDKRARNLARTAGLQTLGTLGILLSSYKKNIISKKETYRIICDLPQHGFRIKEEFFLEILKHLQ